MQEILACQPNWTEYIAAIRRDEDKWQDLNDFAQGVILKKEDLERRRHRGDDTETNHMEGAVIIDEVNNETELEFDDL